MKVDAIRIRNFRSVAYALLESCGGFNVLIGNNNTGKSNLLNALSTFFSAIAGGRFVCLDPQFATQTDFHGHENFYELSIAFQLTLAERDRLVRFATEHAPAMKNAIEGVDPELRLLVTLVGLRNPRAATYVRRVALGRPWTAGTTSAEERVLLEVGDQAGAELIENYAKAERNERDAKEIEQLLGASKRLDSDDWLRMKTESETRRMPFRVFRPLGEPISADTLNKLDGIMRRSSSLDDYQTNLKQWFVELTEQLSLIRSATLLHKVGTLSGEETSIPKYVSLILRELDNLNVLYLTERRNPIGKVEASQLLDLKTRRGGDEKLRAIKSVVSSLLGVEIDAFLGEGQKRGSEEMAELDVDRFAVQANGAGIREALRLILDYEFRKPRLLLVEEPEVHLHPALETSMMQYLRSLSDECQIFITTHSTNFLETAEMRSVYFVSKPNTHTVVAGLAPADAEATLPDELGLRLSSFFMFDRLVFVEGRTDEEALRKLAQRLDLNLAQSNVGFVHMGGARNYGYYAAEATISFLTKRRVDVWFLVDRDERDDAELGKLRALIGDRAQIAILTKRELENYFLCPRAIRELLLLKRESAVSNQPMPSLQGVEEELHRSAISLRETTIQRRVLQRVLIAHRADRRALLGADTAQSFEDRVAAELSRQAALLTNASTSIATIFNEEKDAVDQNWDARAMDLAPGDEILDHTMRTFSHRFRKESDTARLAGLLEESEIHPDLVKFLKSLCE